MKKWIIIASLAFFLVGCGHAAIESELYQHDSLFKNWDHTKFSLWGYRNPTPETMKNSGEQGWWGIEVPYVPAK